MFTNKPVANFNHDLPATHLLMGAEVILLVDDDHMMRTSITELLREKNLPVMEADSAAGLATIMLSSVADIQVAIEHRKLHTEMQHKIVALEQLNHELDKNKDLLVEAERYCALGQMAAQMVHVLRNPITSIGGICRILMKKVSDPEWKRYLDVVISETTRLESTLGELFDFVSHAEPDKSVTNLYPLIRKTVLLVQPTMIKHNITWQVDLDNSREVLVNMDSRQIRQMFLHIMRNALEAMEQKGELQVTGEVVNGWVVVRISDTGPGLSEANLTRARDPFFTTKTYGSGMGLAMVDRIVESHGGTFMLSRKQEGMEAVVELPLAGEG